MSTVRTTAKGTKYLLAPSVAALPTADVEATLDALVAAVPLMARDAFLPFVADANHGDVYGEGSWSVAMEGDYEWPSRFCAEQHDHRTVPSTVHIEPGAGWWLGIYPA